MAFYQKMLPIYLWTLLLVFICSIAASELVRANSGVPASSGNAELPTIVLDPGHGGEDGGAVSPNGLRESDLNLEISLRTGDLLRFLGFPVILTRETDRSICDPGAASVSEKKVSDLKNRVRLTEETPNALLLSIHQNMFPEAKYYGAQVFYAKTSGSQTLAEELQALCGSRLDVTNRRKAKEAEAIYLLQHISCPGVLVECGFLSNPEEERKLQTADYQKKLAAVLAAGLTEYLSGTAHS